MVKRDVGVANRHVLASNGADSDPLKFYCTESATAYGRRFNKFEPRTGRHVGTGYQSNFRPGVYYSERIDHLDNPRIVPLLADNYASVTTKHFQPYTHLDGKEPIPHLCKQTGSGFSNSAKLSIPTQKEVIDACIGRRIASAPADVMPRAMPHLHKIQPKNPIEAENHGYGPSCMQSETKAIYRGKPSDRRVFPDEVLGENQVSGFVHNINIEPVTFNPDKTHKGDVPGWYTPRPTGVSVTTTSYRPSQNPKGNEPLPRLANRSDRQTGFTTSIVQTPEFAASNVPVGKITDAKLAEMKKDDPAEYQNMTQPNSYNSIYRGAYKGLQRPERTEADVLHRTTVGKKDESGFTDNNHPFVATFDNPARFITDNNVRFLDRTATGNDRNGHTWGGVLPPRTDGYTRDTKVHDKQLGQQPNTTATLRRLQPYVARSIKQSDRFFDDHLYDAKINSGIDLIGQC